MNERIGFSGMNLMNLLNSGPHRNLGGGRSGGKGRNGGKPGIRKRGGKGEERRNKNKMENQLFGFTRWNNRVVIFVQRAQDFFSGVTIQIIILVFVII